MDRSKCVCATKVDYASCYQKLLNRISGLAWLMDNQGQIYAGNNSWQDYTGLSKPCFFLDLISPDRRTEIRQLWHTAFEDQNICQARLQLKNADGEYSLFDLEIEGDDNWLICTATAVKYDSSKITDYRQKELALLGQAEFTRRILESSKDCIKVIDLEGRLVYMNDGGQRIMEIDDFERFQYSSWLDFWQGDRSLAETAFAIACAGGIGKFDGYCATAKGTPKCWEVVVTPIFGKDNKVEEILSVSRDITARKVAESALKERNQELDQFTYMVTHDLKAPLRGISNLSAMLLEDLDEQIPDENQHQLKLLQQRVKRMDALINGLLNYARVGKQEIALESVNLEQLFQEIIDSLTPPTGFKITATKLPTIKTKRILLSQVLSNLISNAIKHHHLDTGEIDLTVKDAGRYYKFAIADDGPGIREADRDRIFEIFQTVENNTSSTNTGIGLALIKKIVREQGGELWLDSNTEKGCKFYFTWQK